ncbi:MAG: CBS domain-containing protein [Nitrososphaeraceae archaeon]
MIEDKSFNRSSLLSMPVTFALNSNVIVLEQSRTVAEAITAMKDNLLRSILVSDRGGQIIGLVSKTDVLFKVVAIHKSPAKIMIKEVMSAPVISIPPDMSIVDALSVMEKHVIRQLVVSTSNSVYGIVSRDDIMVKMEKAAMETINAANITSSLCIMNPFASAHIKDKGAKLICPHCQTEYGDKDVLTKHVQSTHS